MTRRTRTIVTTAASLMLGCSVGFGQQSQSQNPTGTGQQNISPSARPMQSLPTEARTGMQDSSDMSQQIKQFAQDPKTACDKMFVLCAAMTNQCEIESAQQAEQKASNPQVKEIARQIQKDHKLAQEQLRPVAQQLGVQLPQSLPPEMQQAMQIMAALPTDKFEKHYIVMLQAGHAKSLIEYRAVAQLSENEQVKQYAQRQLPGLSQHYGHVQQAAVAMGLPSSGPEAMPASGRIEGGSGSTDRNRN